MKKNTFSGPEGKRRRRRMVREGERERMEGRIEEGGQILAADKNPGCGSR